MGTINSSMQAVQQAQDDLGEVDDLPPLGQDMVSQSPAPDSSGAAPCWFWGSLSGLPEATQTFLCHALLTNICVLF